MMEGLCKYGRVLVEVGRFFKLCFFIVLVCYLEEYLFLLNIMLLCLFMSFLSIVIIVKIWFELVFNVFFNWFVIYFSELVRMVFIVIRGLDIDWDDFIVWNLKWFLVNVKGEVWLWLFGLCLNFRIWFKFRFIKLLLVVVLSLFFLIFRNSFLSWLFK